MTKLAREHLATSQYRELSNTSVILHPDRVDFQIFEGPHAIVWYGRWMSTLKLSKDTFAQTSPTNHPRAITTDINSTIPNLSHPPKSSFPKPPASTGAPEIFSPQRQ